MLIDPTEPDVQEPDPDQFRIDPGACPPGILAQLQEVDPRAALVYLGDETWHLGIYDETNEDAQKAASREVDHMLKTGIWTKDRYFRLALLNFYADTGFRPITMYFETRVPDQRIVDDFRERDFNFRNKPDSTFEDRLYESDTERDEDRRKARMADYAETEFLSLHKFIIQGAKSVVNKWRGSR